jgi:hypothetical protein
MIVIWSCGRNAAEPMLVGLVWRALPVDSSPIGHIDHALLSGCGHLPSQMRGLSRQKGQFAVLPDGKWDLARAGPTPVSNS